MKNKMRRCNEKLQDLYRVVGTKGLHKGVLMPEQKSYRLSANGTLSPKSPYIRHDKCTGYRDDKGKPIYFGDVLLIRDSIYTVTRSKADLSLTLFSEQGSHRGEGPSLCACTCRVWVIGHELKYYSATKEATRILQKEAQEKENIPPKK